MDRRNFFKIMGLSISTALVDRNARAVEVHEIPESIGVLVDTTRCLGCRSCEYACAEANGLPEPEEDPVFENERKTTEAQLSVVNRYNTDAGEVFVKKQCMHCNQPACAAACLTRAMKKMEEGPVIWHEDKCMGCRFCMISCPFDIPKFEYKSAVPKIQKCKLCWDRLKEGKQPACVENCPNEVLLFGKRKELIEIAKERIYSEPKKYFHHIYGEYEIGGTGWIYLASVPFEQLGFRKDIGLTPYPEFTKEYLYAVPIILIIWPTFLLALSNATSQGVEKNKERE